MRRRLLPLLLLVVACSAATTVPTNRYGLKVVRDRATYERLAKADPGQELVDLSTFIPGIVLDIRYATPNNFMQKTLYPVAKAYLRRPAAEALRNVQADLAKEGLALKVFDAYRPYRITEMMWEPIKNPDFVADPAKGSRHNRGAAVDVTLIDKGGNELILPSTYDDFSPRARHDFNELHKAAIINRKTLLEKRRKYGIE
jgi:D-alanyl-D-alanine dipeptidase